MEVQEGEVVKKKKLRRGTPTLKQIKALQYINMGMSKRQAMIKAGYSEKSASKPKTKLFKYKGVKAIILSMAGELVDQGLTTAYMVSKFQEWLEAKKPHSSLTEPDRMVPDYKTQLEAYKEWKKVMDDQMKSDVMPGIKRKLTIEEFVSK